MSKSSACTVPGSDRAEPPYGELTVGGGADGGGADPAVATIAVRLTLPVSKTTRIV